MNDRIMTFLLVLIVLAGIVTYDRYIVAIKKQPSPIEAFLKQTGLYQFKETVLVDEQTLRKNYRAKVRERLMELVKEQQHAIDLRIQGRLKREGILEQQMAVTAKIDQMVTVYARDIDGQKGRFLRQFPQIDQFERNIEGAIADRSLENRVRIYKVEKAALLNSLQEMTSDPLRNIPGLADALATLDRSISTVDPQDDDACGDALGCLKEKTKEIRKTVGGIANAVVQRPAAYLGAVVQEVRMLQQENKILNRNSVAIEDKMLEIANDMQDDMRFVINKITDLEDADLEEVLKTYRVGYSQWEELLGILVLNSKRWLEAYQLSFYKLESALPKVIDLGPEYGTVSNFCRAFMGETQMALDEYVQNERDVEQVFVAQSAKWKRFFDGIDIYLKGELEPMFVEDMEFEPDQPVATAPTK